MTDALAAWIGVSALHLLTGRRSAQPGLAAALLAEAWAAQGVAYAFPGAAGLAHDFPDPATRPLLGRIPEWAASAVMLSVIGAGYGLERRRIARSPLARARRRIELRPRVR